MAFWRARAFQSLGYNDGTNALVGGNSIVFSQGDFLTQSTEFLIQATAWSTIVGVSLAELTTASNNQTVARTKVTFQPVRTGQTYLVPISGTSIVFAGNLVASNVVNLNVNGVAMTPVTFATDNATTLAAIATQLATQFSTVIASAAYQASNTVAIVPVGLSSSVIITGIVVTGGAGQTTWSQVAPVTSADVGKFYDILTATQFVNGTTESTSSNQLKLEQYISGDFGEFSIANT